MVKIILILFFISLLNFDINFSSISNESKSINISNSGDKLLSKTKPVNNKEDLIFVVSHNKSPNFVVYQANKEANGYLNAKKPIDVFWLLKNKGNITEELNLLEWKLAFGFKLVKVIDGQKYRIKLNAIKEKVITIIRKANGKVESYLKINGKEAILKKVFFNYEESFYLPQVKYLDFTGIDIKTKKLITERLIINK